MAKVMEEKVYAQRGPREASQTGRRVARAGFCAERAVVMHFLSAYERTGTPLGRVPGALYLSRAVGVARSTSTDMNCSFL